MKMYNNTFLEPLLNTKPHFYACSEATLTTDNSFVMSYQLNIKQTCVPVFDDDAYWKKMIF